MTALSTSLKLQNIIKMKFLHKFQVIWGGIEFDCVKTVFAEDVLPQHLLSGLHVQI